MFVLHIYIYTLFFFLCNLLRIHPHRNPSHWSVIQPQTSTWARSGILLWQFLRAIKQHCKYTSSRDLHKFKVTLSMIDNILQSRGEERLYEKTKRPMLARYFQHWGWMFFSWQFPNCFHSAVFLSPSINIHTNPTVTHSKVTWSTIFSDTVVRLKFKIGFENAKKRKYTIPVALKMSLPQIVIMYLERRVEVSKYWKTPYWKIRFNLFFYSVFSFRESGKKSEGKTEWLRFFFFLSLNQNNKFLRFLLFGTHEATPVNFWQATKRRPISPFWLNNHTNSGLYKRKFFTNMA